MSSRLSTYMPLHQKDRKNAPREKRHFYDQVSSTIDILENKSILFFAVDFNAKMEKLKEEDTYTCLDKLLNGKRNNNEQTLLELCKKRSAFNHPARH